MILPDTPNSLLARGKADESRAVLQRIRGTEEVDAEYEDIVTAVLTASTVKTPYLAINPAEVLLAAAHHVHHAPSVPAVHRH